MQMGCRTTEYQGASSQHYDGKKFFNPGIDNGKSWLDLLRWQLGGGKADWPDWVDDTKATVPTSLPANVLARLTFVNHATFLIQTHLGNILTDPIWSQRASPFQWVGPARVRAPGIAFESLPKIDFVLISHNHFDHMDKTTLRRLREVHDPLFFVGLGDSAYLQRFGITKYKEMDWGDVVTMGILQIHFEQAAHWSRRSLNDTNKSLWGSYVIAFDTAGTDELQHMQKIYFAGDTGYHTHFRDAFKKYGPMNISLLPIGAYEPRWFMKNSHMNPEEAVKAHQDLHSQLSIGMHFKTFHLTNEAIDAPVEDLNAALKMKPEVGSSFVVLNFGESKDLLPNAH